MAIEYERTQRSVLEGRHLASIEAVDDLARQLKTALELQSVAIDAAHIHGASSAAVQRIVSAILKDRLGFEEEVVLTEEMGIVSRPRPDFFYRISPSEGVIAEVERGGPSRTITTSRTSGRRTSLQTPSTSSSSCPTRTGARTDSLVSVRSCE